MIPLARARPHDPPVEVPRGVVVAAAFAGCFLLAAGGIAAVIAAPVVGLSDLELALLALSPVACYIAFRLPVGALLGVAFVGGPLVNYILIPGNLGIPWQAGLPLGGAEAVLLLRVLATGEHPRPRVVEFFFLAALFFALFIGVIQHASVRVMSSEFIETTNLVILAAMLRAQRFDRHDVASLTIVANLVIAPFVLRYLVQSFGLRSIDFYQAQVPFLLLMNAWVLIGGHASTRWRLPLLLMSLALAADVFSASQRGSFFVAVLGIVIMMGAHSAESARSVGRSVFVGLAVLVAALAVYPVASALAPASVGRFAEGTNADTFTLRVTEAQDALRAAMSSPGGLGLGAVVEARSLLDYSQGEIRITSVAGTFIHNSYAWYAAKTGFFGLGTMLLVIGTATFAAIRALRGHERAPEAQLAVALLLVSCAGAFGGPALHGFYYTTWVAVGIALATPMLARGRAPIVPRSTPVPRGVATPPAREAALASAPRGQVGDDGAREGVVGGGGRGTRGVGDRR